MENTNCVQVMQDNGAGIIRHLFRYPSEKKEISFSWCRPFYSNFLRDPQEDSIFDQRVEHGSFENADEAMKAANNWMNGK